MSFSYSTSLSADRDRLRFFVNDTDSSDYIYENEELDGVLSVEPNLYLAAALCLNQRAVAFAEKAIRYRVGGDNRGILDVDRTKVAAEIRATAKTFQEKAFSVPDEGWDRMAFDIDGYGRDVSDYQGISTDDEIL